MGRKNLSTSIFIAVTCAACQVKSTRPDHPVDHPPYASAVDPNEVEIVGAEPDRSVYEFAGDIQGQGTAGEIGEAARLARANFKHEAEELGATRAVIDTNNADKFGWGRRTVVFNGRAYRKKAAPRKRE